MCGTHTCVGSLDMCCDGLYKFKCDDRIEGRTIFLNISLLTSEARFAIPGVVTSSVVEKFDVDSYVELMVPKPSSRDQT